LAAKQLKVTIMLNIFPPFPPIIEFCLWC